MDIRELGESTLLENIDEKIIWNTVSGENCLIWCRDGSVIFWTKDSVYVFKSRFSYMSMHEAHWISVKVVFKHRCETKPKLTQNVLTDCLMNTLSNESGLIIKDCKYCENAFNVLLGNLLSVVLSDGSILLLQSEKIGNAQYSLRNPGTLLEMSGFGVLFDLSNSISLWALERGMQGNVVGHDLVACDKIILVVVATNVTVSVWRLSCEESVKNFSFEIVAQYNMVNSKHSLFCVGTSSRSVNRCCTRTKCITQIKAERSLFSTGIQSTILFSVFVGTANGVCVKLDVAGDSWGIRNELVTFCWAQRGRCEKPVDHISAGKIIDAITGESVAVLYVVRGGGVECVRCGDGENLASPRKHILARSPTSVDCNRESDGSHVGSPICGSAVLWAPVGSDGQVCESVLLTGSLDGSLAIWVPPLLAVDVTFQHAAHISSSVCRQTGLHGVAVDPLGIMFAYCSKVGALHENSRETQLNPALLRSHSKLGWSLAPLVDKLWISSELKVADLFTYVLQHSSPGGCQSLDALPLAFMHSLEHCRKNNHGLKSATASYKASNSDSVSSSDSEEDLSFSQSHGSNLRGQSHSGSTQHRSSVKSDPVDKYSNGMEAIAERIRRFNGPGVVDSLRRSVDRLVGGALLVCQPLQSGLPSDLSELCEVMLRMPTDFDGLARCMVVWQMVHVIVTAAYKSLDVPIENTVRLVVQSLRQRLLLCQCVCFLNECLPRYSDGTAAEESIDHQIVLRMLNVVRTIGYGCVWVMALGDMIEATLRQKQVSFVTLAEICCVCGNAELQFDPKQPIQSTCLSCETVVDRCCFSLGAILVADDLGEDDILLKCPCCLAVTTKQSVVHSKRVHCVTCPFCRLKLSIV